MPQSKKILIVAESINVEDSSGSKANVALIQNLKEAGFELWVYHYTRKNINLPGIRCISIKEKKYNLMYFLSRFQRHFQKKLKIIINKPLENFFGFSFTFFNDINSIAESLKETKTFEPDLIVTLSKGASFRPHYALLKLPHFHSKWLAYIHDPYPFHLYPQPYNWSEPGYQQKINFFNEVASKCQWAGYPSLLLGEWMENHYKDFTKKRIIIPHQINEENVSHEKIPSWFDPNKFNIVHAGNLMKQREPFALLNGFSEFLKLNPEAGKNARILLIGSTAYHKKKLNQLKLQIPELYISDGVIKYDAILRIQNEASVNIILESKADLSPFLPGKFPHCIAAGKIILVLGPKDSEVRRLLGYNYEWWSEADDVNRIADLINRLYKIWKNEGAPKIKYEDLYDYMSTDYLKEELDKILV